MKKINYEKLKFSSKIISSEEALKDVEPFNWTKEVLNGEKKVIVSSCNKSDNKDDLK